MPATQTDYNTGDIDSYSVPLMSLPSASHQRSQKKAEKEYEEVWKNKPHFLGMNLVHLRDTQDTLNAWKCSVIMETMFLTRKHQKQLKCLSNTSQK